MVIRLKDLIKRLRGEIVQECIEGHIDCQSFGHARSVAPSQIIMEKVELERILDCIQDLALDYLDRNEV